MICTAVAWNLHINDMFIPIIFPLAVPFNFDIFLIKYVEDI